MLEPVALHRAGASFRLPGLFQDSRGVVVGSEAAVLVHSHSQLVSLLRLLSTQVTLAELFPSLRCEEVRSAIGSQGYLLRLRCSESRSLDLCARAAAFSGGLLVVGSGRHLVQYRDAGAPLGYDAVSLSSHSEGDYVVYSATAVLTYSRLAELSLRRLVQQQPLLNRRGRLEEALRAHDPRSPLWLLLPQALVLRVLRYLWQRSIAAAAMLPEPPSALAPRELTPLAPEGQLLLSVSSELAGAPGALLGLPGLRWLAPLGEHLAVELGHEHPFDLETFGSLFERGQRHLFLAGGAAPLSLPAAPFVPIERLVQLGPTAVAELLNPVEETARKPSLTPGVAAGKAYVANTLVTLPLRLAAEATPARVAATLVAYQQLGLLADLLYLLPMSTLSSLRGIALNQGLLLIGDLGYLPLGKLFYEAAPQVLVPLGQTVVPRLPPELLAARLGVSGDSWCLLHAGTEDQQEGGAPAHLPLSAGLLPSQGLESLGRLLAWLPVPLQHEFWRDPPPSDCDAAPQAVYPSLGLLWPLWGSPRPLSGPAQLPPPRIDQSDKSSR